MLTNDLIIDGFGRIKQEVHHVLTGLDVDALAFRPNDTTNSIAWLVWHLTRVQDNHLAELRRQPQVWLEGWHDKFNLPFDTTETGYGQSAVEVAKVRVNSDLLSSYYDAVHDTTVAFVQALDESDYGNVVDQNWDPPVTLAVRLISVLSDDLQHIGQAAYIRGLLNT